MRAWAVVENGKPLQEIELPTPEPKGTEVLLETTYCGVCHSDLHIWDGYYDVGGGKRMSLKDRGLVLPLTMGHEIVGRVVKLGPEATGVKVGDLRIVYPWVGCGHCAACLADEDNMCLTPRSLCVMHNGGYGTHVVAPHPRHLVDPGTLDPAVAAT
jgi:propanol-preferring alcohol dehydrogenase